MRGQRSAIGHNRSINQFSLSDLIKFRGRNNNIGLLRVLFACLVIVAHSPEMIDGNRSREFLTQVFGTISFGEVGVDAFFLLSGFLIAKSLEGKSSLSDYFASRCARILPGYATSFLICIFIVAPLAGGSLSIGLIRQCAEICSQLIHLTPPVVPDVFNGLAYPGLNGPMWTISHEFRCYIVAAIVSTLKSSIPHGRYVIAILVIILLFVAAFHPLDGTSWPRFGKFLGKPEDGLRLLPIFGFGSVIYLFKSSVLFSRTSIVIALSILVAGLFSSLFAELMFTLAGGYLIFAAAFYLPTSRLSNLTTRSDISYGLYLYAWPIASLLIWYGLAIMPLSLIFFTTLLAGLAGLVSWHFVEQPVLQRLSDARSRRMRASAADFTSTSPPAPETLLPSEQGRSR